MSWVQEEWKSGLASNVLAKISELEDALENVTKERKCMQFQTESLQAVLDKSKVSEDELKKLNQDTEKRLANAVTELENSTIQLEKLKAVVKEKDIKILNLTNEVANAKRERDFEKMERQQLERECDQIQKELCEKSCRLDCLSKKLTEIEENPQAILANHELIKEDTEICRIENLKLIEQIGKLKEERELERSERIKLEVDIEHIHRDEYARIIENLKQDLRAKCDEFEELREEYDELRSVLETQRSHNAFLQQQIKAVESIDDENNCFDNYKEMDSEIAELRNGNEGINEAVEAERINAQQLIETYDVKIEEQRKDLELLENQIVAISNERDESFDRLREERELFIKAGTKMKEEIESMKKEGQEEREMYMELERELKEEIEALKHQIEELRIEKGGASNVEVLKDSKELEVDNKSLRETIKELEKKTDLLLKEKSELLQHNQELSNEICKEKEQRSDVEETMMGDIDSIQSCMQTKINQLQHANEELRNRNRNQEESADELQLQVEELCQELEEVNKLLNAERDHKAKLANEVDEMKKQEEYRAKFASLESKDSHLEEKDSLSNLVKKRSERWNVEVYELKKKIDELEKKNRELSNIIDKRDSSVVALRHGFENKLREEQLSCSGGRKATRDNGTPDRSMEPFDVRPRSAYNTPMSKSWTNMQQTSDDGNNTPACLLKSKDQLIEILKQEMFEIRNERDNNAKTYKINVNALQNEVAIMKEKIREKEQMIMSFTAHVDLSPCKDIFKSLKKDDKKTELFRNSTNDSGVDIQDIKSRQMKPNSVADLRDVVVGFEKESSELQEIIDESKDAIFELTKALQASEEVYLVDSKNNAIANEQVMMGQSDVTDNFRSKENDGQLTEEKSYVLTRLSQSDIDMTSVLSKLRVAVSQLESRLDRVQAEKRQTEAKIKKIRTTKDEGKKKKNEQLEMYKSTHEEETELPLEAGSSRSAVIDIARKRDATILDGTVDDIAHEENRKPKDDNAFHHSSRCRLLWQQLCEAQASLSCYEREIHRQRVNYQKNLMECKEKMQQSEHVEKSIAEAERMANEQYKKQDYVITDLEEKLVIEKHSADMLQQKLENAQSQLEEARENNSTLNEKLEETRMLLHKHHKSSEKKLEALMDYMKEDMIDQVKNVIDNELRSASTSKRRSSGQNRTLSCNDSFYSPEANIETELASKRSRGRRGRGIEEQAYRTATNGYNTIDELDNLKSRLSGIQDNVKCLVASIDQAQREKSKIQEERTRLLERLHRKDEDLKKLDSRLGDEKQRVKENEEEYRAELDALKSEQLEVYKEFREMCDKVKRKDIEVLNKTKQIKLLTAEWKEKELKLSTQIDNLQNENQMLWSENGDLRVELERSKSSSDDFVRKMKSAETELGQLYKKLSFVDKVLHECRQKGLYQ